jgi:hypothetical protein
MKTLVLILSVITNRISCVSFAIVPILSLLSFWKFADVFRSTSLWLYAICLSLSSLDIQMNHICGIFSSYLFKYILWHLFHSPVLMKLPLCKYYYAWIKTPFIFILSLVVIFFRVDNLIWALSSTRMFHGCLNSVLSFSSGFLNFTYCTFHFKIFFFSSYTF